jgi:hypothetical protein
MAQDKFQRLMCGTGGLSGHWRFLVIATECRYDSRLRVEQARTHIVGVFPSFFAGVVADLKEREMAARAMGFFVERQESFMRIEGRVNERDYDWVFEVQAEKVFSDN